MLRPGLVVPPRFTRESLFAERKSTWLELFYDLIFVVAVSQASSQLSMHFNGKGIIKFGLIFLVTWWAWVGQTFYLTRFDSDDVIHRIVTAIQMFAVAGMALAIPEAYGAKSNLFILSYAAIRSVLVFEYFRVGKHLPEARVLSTAYVRGFTLAIVIWSLSLGFSGRLRMGIWLLALAIDIATPLLLRTAGTRIPPHSSHIPERFGLFTIIVLGEAVLSVVVGMQSAELTPYAAMAGAVGWVLAFTIWWGYFDGVRAAAMQEILTPDSVDRFRIWMYSHLPLTFFIVVLSVGVKQVVSLPPMASLPGHNAQFVIASSFGLMVMLNLLFLFNPNVTNRDLNHRFLIPHWAIACIQLPLLFVADLIPGIIVLGVVTCVSVGQIVLSLREPLPSGKAE